MPNRMLREGILTSERVNELTAQQEVFYRRLMSVVDDFGRYYASPKLLRSACYPLQIDKVKDADIEAWLGACQKVGLVQVYQQDGKRYLELTDFRQQIRAKTSKFPRMRSTCAADDKHPQEDAHLGGVGVGDEDEDGDEDERARERAQPGKRSSNSIAASDDFPLPPGLSREKWREWVKFRSSIRKPLNETLANRQADYLGDAIKSGHDAAAIIDESMRNGWTGLFAKDHHKPERARVSVETFRERDERNARQRWEEMTGRIHPDNLQAAASVIDITPAAAPLIPIGVAK